MCAIRVIAISCGACANV